jgi:hypothetical protein
LHNGYCQRHRKNTRHPQNCGGEEQWNTTPDNSFPRLLTEDEERTCVDEARRRTSPEGFTMRSCLVCGRLHIGRELVYVTESEVREWKPLLLASRYYDRVPHSHFRYDGPHSGLNGMVLDKLGFMNSDEVVYGSPVMLRVCRTCRGSLRAHRIPDLALANGL